MTTAKRPTSALCPDSHRRTLWVQQPAPSAESPSVLCCYLPLRIAPRPTPFKKPAGLFKHPMTVLFSCSDKCAVCASTSGVSLMAGWWLTATEEPPTAGRAAGDASHPVLAQRGCRRVKVKHLNLISQCERPTPQHAHTGVLTFLQKLLKSERNKKNLSAEGRILLSACSWSLRSRKSKIRLICWRIHKVFHNRGAQSYFGWYWFVE